VVTRGGTPIDLTNKEFGVLAELLKARGGVVSSEELLERVWDANTDPFTTTVRVTVMTLRKKVGDPPLIETVVGAGYRVPEPVVVSPAGSGAHPTIPPPPWTGLKADR
jgi:DNA-binding response OmpR family regulator